MSEIEHDPWDKIECFEKEHNVDRNIQLSIAISLKRIADKLELSQKQPFLLDRETYEKMIASHPGNDYQTQKVSFP